MSYSIIGTGSMGGNLALNISKKEQVNLFNRSYTKVNELIANNPNVNLIGHKSIEDLIENTQTPRTIITMLPHGKPTTDMISKLSKIMTKDDTILDLANDYYKDSEKRFYECYFRRIKYLDCGISGGYKGALNGPALMIGGPQKYYEEQKTFFDSFCGNHQHMGNKAGDGHFTKMVHNGIEYAMLQGIADIYTYCNKDVKIMSQVIENLSNYPIYGYLIKSANNICENYDLDNIDDVCNMNNTGLWCTTIALERSIPLSIITNSVLNRIDSKIKNNTHFNESYCKVSLNSACNALQFIYCQALIEGYSLLKSEDISISKAQKSWNKSTIIECQLIDENIDYLQDLMDTCYFSAKKVLLECISNDANTTVLSTAIQKYNLSQDVKKNTNFIMAQRNDFGGHDVKYV